MEAVEILLAFLKAFAVGGLICGIVAVLWDAFGKQNGQMG